VSQHLEMADRERVFSTTKSRVARLVLCRM
jgi:hypothetical protein